MNHCIPTLVSLGFSRQWKGSPHGNGLAPFIPTLDTESPDYPPGIQVPPQGTCLRPSALTCPSPAVRTQSPSPNPLPEPLDALLPASLLPGALPALPPSGGCPGHSERGVCPTKQALHFNQAFRSRGSLYIIGKEGRQLRRAMGEFPGAKATSHMVFRVRLAQMYPFV